MKFRTKFTLTLAAVAVIPIMIAAIVTRQMIANSYRDGYRAEQAQAQSNAAREVARLAQGLTQSTTALASADHPLTGALLREYVKNASVIDGDYLRKLREQGAPVMQGLGLDELTIVGPNHEILVAPHMMASVGETEPSIAKQARQANGAVYYRVAKVRASVGNQGGAKPAASQGGVVVLAMTSREVHDGRATLVVQAGRVVGEDLMAILRSGRVDARLMAGDVVGVPSRGAWPASGQPAHVALNGLDGQPVAQVQIAVAAPNYRSVLANITALAVGVAVLALLVVLLIGNVVAKRMSRDLDQLVAGAANVTKGNLAARVPVRANDEIGAVAKSFNVMTEELETSKARLVIAERIAAWQEIARRLAHEIKNPLTPIQMSMDTLRKTWRKQHPSFGEILEESTTTVLQEADRLKRIVTEFSDFARMPKPQFGSLDLNEVVRSGLALYQESNVFLTLGELPTIDADRAQLQQVLLNLVENARDAVARRHPDGGGRIDVATAAKKDRVLLIVADNGPGIAATERDKVFAPYYSTKLSQGGTGLGLAIVHRIVSDHGGKVVVDEGPQNGARFTIELPLDQTSSLVGSRA